MIYRCLRSIVLQNLTVTRLETRASGGEYYVYNKNDQPILYRDSKESDGRRWIFTKYDALGRVIMTGLKYLINPANGDGLTREEVQNQADQNDYCWEYLYSPPGNVGNNNYYSNNTYPQFASSEMWSVVLLTVNYYDRYTFYKNNSGTVSVQSLHNDNELNLDIPAPLIGIYNPDQKSVTGLPTVSFTNFSANYSTNNYLTSVMYYDKYGRNIQTRMENHMPGYDFYTNSYLELTSRVVNTSRIHKVINGAITTTHTELTQNAYDAYGRLTVSDYCYDGMTPHQNTTFAYDAAGNMVTKTQGPAVTSTPYQTISYAYNIKGWLTQINDPNNVSDQGALFGEQLFYNIVNPNINNAEMYNGNISGIIWQNTGALSTQSNAVGGLKSYSFAYDGINRLENGTYKEVLQNSWNNNNKYNEVLTYDRNGNIETLQRMGIRNNNIGLIDNLSYTYDGNRLKAVDDAITDNSAGGFADNGNYYTLIPEYTYDANGNMTSDVNKGIEGLTYNYMNLLISARRGLNECVEYLYDAAGVKLQQKHSNRSTNYQFTTDFVANFVYEDGQLAHVNTLEGRIVYNTNGTIRQEFNLKDHLGNVRVVYSVENGVVTTRQIDNYYPFGYNIKGLSVNKYATTRPNEYLYNGKMMQDEMGLNWLDYGARMYDAVLGRWNVPDPLSDLNRRFSPYCYAINNPIRFIDPDGMDTTFTDKKAEADFQKTQTTTNERIDEINKKLDDPDISKKERKALTAEKENLEKVKADFDYICDPNTPEITYSSDESKIDEGADGTTYASYDPNTGEVSSAKVYIKEGALSAYVHENRHTRQNWISMNEEARNIEAYTYESYYDSQAVNTKITNAYEEKNRGLDPNLVKNRSSFGIPDMVRYNIEKENKNKKVK